MVTARPLRDDLVEADMTTRSPRLGSIGPVIDRRSDRDALARSDRGRRLLVTPVAAGLLLAVVILLVFAARAAAVPEPGERARSIRAPHCALQGSRTIAANRHVRVFRARTGLGEVYGCRRSANRAYELGVAAECQNYDEIDGVVVAGNMAALNVRTCSLTSSQSRAVLINLRDGRVRFASQPLASAPDVDREYDAIRGMVVTPEGRLAWLGVRVRGGVLIGAEVRRRARGSRSRSVLLDRGAAIDPRSLRRRGNRASWRKAGTRRCARI